MLLSRRARRKIFCVLGLCCFLVLVNLYVLTLQKDDLSSGLYSIKQSDTTFKDGEKLWKLLSKLKSEQGCSLSAKVSWKIADEWLRNGEILPSDTNRGLGCLMKRMTKTPIIRVSAGVGGTQLKLLLTVEGDQRIVFKPKRYPRNEIIEGTPYAGFDRHNGEIAAFHLNRLLDFRRGPITVGRVLNLSKEIAPVADRKLLNTFLTKENKRCFYGVCYYCVPNDAACADEKDQLEGALILWLPDRVKLTKTIRHPWSRTYKEGVKAPWETNDDYCTNVKAMPRFKESRLLLDLIDISVFDFLIGNADRHNFQLIDSIEDSMIVLLDNGKSFGNPDHDEVSILAPLQQCCMLRRKTWERLLLFHSERNQKKKMTLSKALDELLSLDPLYPILTESHLRAVDRRLKTVVETVQDCITKITAYQVLREDGNEF